MNSFTNPKSNSITNLSKLVIYSVFGFIVSLILGLIIYFSIHSVIVDRQNRNKLNEVYKNLRIPSDFQLVSKTIDRSNHEFLDVWTLTSTYKVSGHTRYEAFQQALNACGLDISIANQGNATTPTLSINSYTAGVDNAEKEDIQCSINTDGGGSELSVSDYQELKNAPANTITIMLDKQ